MDSADFNGRVRSRVAFSAEIIFISALILVTRCANYRDVFCGGQINFIDADCYARMTRARICFQHPGTIVRRHDFENFPIGTSPHTTALFDYVIVALAAALQPLSKNALDLAGAFVSPLISIVLGIFLCWWSRMMQIRFRWGLVVLYAVSPILAHGFALGRPDHQSLLIALITLAICAEWRMAAPWQGRAPAAPARLAFAAPQSSARQRQTASLKRWSVTSGASWALALWVSLYEPIILLTVVFAFRARDMVRRPRRIGWIVFAVIFAIAFVLERRIPQWPKAEWTGALKNWSATIGELSHVSLADPIWFNWCGWLLLFTPILFWPRQGRVMPCFLIALLSVAFGLTIWQARWSYFFVIIFAFSVPELLSVLRKPIFAAAIFISGLFPIAQSWDRMFADDARARRTENNVEMVELRAIASHVDGAFLAPWWFSPALSYWSGQAGLGGSSHESIGGVVESAKLFGTQNTEEFAQAINRHRVKWIIAYDADRVAQNSARILDQPISANAFCYVLDRRPSATPPFLRLVAQTGHFKLFRALNP